MLCVAEHLVASRRFRAALEVLELVENGPRDWAATAELRRIARQLADSARSIAPADAARAVDVSALFEALDFLGGLGRYPALVAACELAEAIERLSLSDAQRERLHDAYVRIGKVAEAAERKSAPRARRKRTRPAKALPPGVLAFPSSPGAA